MSGENTRRFDETFQHVTSTGNAGQYDREQIVGETNRLKGSEMGTGAPQLLTDLGKGWHDAADKLDAVRDRIADVGERLAEAWCSQASAASQRALMRIHDASKDLSGTAYGMHRYLDGVGETMGQHLASFPTGNGEGAVEGFMGDYGRGVASGLAGPAGVLPGNPAGNVGEAVYGTVGSWVDSGLGALGIGGGDPNQQYQEALAALNRDLVATNTLMPNHLSTELPQIDGGGGSYDDIWKDWGSGDGKPGGGPPSGGPSGREMSGGGSQSYSGSSHGLPDSPGGVGSDVDAAGLVEGTPIGIPVGSDEPGGGLAGTPGGPSVSGGPGGGIGTGTPGTGGGGLPGTGGGGVIGGAGIRPGMTPGIVPMGGAGAGGGRQASAGGAMGRGAGAGTARAGAGGGMMPMGGGGTGSGTGPGGKTGGGRLSGAGGGRAAGGMMPMGGAGGRGSEEKHSSRESWLVEDDDPWGTDEADNVPPGVIK